MHPRSRVSTAIVLSFLLALASSCGKKSDDNKSPLDPTGNEPTSTTDCSKVSVLGAPKGKVSATVGSGPFTGGIATGGSVYTEIPAQPALGLPSQDSFILVGVCGDGSQLTILAPGKTGLQQIGVGLNGDPIADPTTKQPLPYLVRFQYVKNGAAADAYFTSLVGGTGSVTVNAVSKTAASGSFTVTMVKQNATGGVGVGTLTASGTFTVTF